MTDFFRIAVGLARAEGDSTLKRIASKAAAMAYPTVCSCSAYRLTHRAGEGECPALDSINKRAADRAMASGAW